ncbi:uncharacterized protein LOC115879675 [Sitophilus oryzae]|uniref:Uncharacterized protein LOC115879675 n=1 Tax=Sitophilus oryzae TaxID=7048 RepID=A0A6J2XNM0_SITOR|nr:uncharacterized protein LOC115879675 [Sitophilus oryzae]
MRPGYASMIATEEEKCSRGQMSDSQNAALRSGLLMEGLKTGCSLAPLLFKIYVKEALKKWKRRCGGMGLPIGDSMLYTLLFADDQVLITGDRDDALHAEGALGTVRTIWIDCKYKKDRIHHSDLDNGMGKAIKNCSKFKYLGVTLPLNGKKSSRISRRTKQMVYNSIFESVCTYGMETWELIRRSKDRLLALEMDYWKRSNRTSPLEHVRNVCIREEMKVNGTILDTIESKRLLWFGHLQKMEDVRIPKRVWNSIPVKKRKRGRPARTWLLVAG